RRRGQAVVSPEELLADEHGGDAEHPGADRLLGLQLQLLLDHRLANLGEDMVRIEANRLQDGAEVGLRAETASIEEVALGGRESELADRRWRQLRRRHGGLAANSCREAIPTASAAAADRIRQRASRIRACPAPCTRRASTRGCVRGR